MDDLLAHLRARRPRIGAQRADPAYRIDLHLNVDAVEDRPGQTVEIADAVALTASAALAGAIPEPAWAGISRHDQLESGGVERGAFGP